MQGFTNHEAVEVLRSTGQMVTLRLERYLRGPKFEQLQVAIAASEMKPNTNSATASPSIMSLPRFPITVSLLCSLVIFICLIFNILNFLRTEKVQWKLKLKVNQEKQ